MGCQRGREAIITALFLWIGIHSVLLLVMIFILSWMGISAHGGVVLPRGG